MGRMLGRRASHTRQLPPLDVVTWLLTPLLGSFHRTKKALLACKRGDWDEPASTRCLQLVKAALFLKTQGEFFP